MSPPSQTSLPGPTLTWTLQMVVLSGISLLLPSLQSACLPCTKLVLMHICCCCSVAQWCPTLCNPMDCSTPGFPALHHLPELTQTHVHWVSDIIQPSHPLSSPSPAFNLSQRQGYFNEPALCIRWPKYWSFSFSISPSNEYSGLISFRINSFDLLAGQGTIKSLLKHHSSKAPILWRSAFLMVQLSHLYMTTEKP